MGSDEYIHYCDCHNVTQSTCIKLYTLNMYNLWYVKDISIKLFKKVVTNVKRQKKGRRVEQENHGELVLIFKAQVKEELAKNSERKAEVSGTLGTKGRELFQSQSGQC